MQKIDLRLINPRDYDNKILSQEEIIVWFENERAFWQYQGEPSYKRPHAILTSGLCSNGFFDCLRVLYYPNIAEILGRHLARKINFHLALVNLKVDWVISPPYAGITFGYEVAKALGAVFMMVELDFRDSAKKNFLWQRMTIPVGANVLLVDELTTTGGTLNKVRQAVKEGNGGKEVNFLPLDGVLVYRPERLPDSREKKVIALVNKEIQDFKPTDCPYCAAGSPRYRPKTHWKELTGK